MNYKLIKIKDRIWHLQFDTRYDLAMHFVRYQEFYESPNPKFRGKKFYLFDFMRWYSLEQSDGRFEYPVHWSGFNIPIRIFDQLNLVGIDDKNIYDELMYKVYNIIKSADGASCYLIGTYSKEKDNSTFEHEFAHALYALNKNYKKEMDAVTKTVNTKKAYSYFDKIGYTEKVFKDELQAYASEEINNNSKLLGITKKQRKLYVDIYKKYKGSKT